LRDAVNLARHGRDAPCYGERIWIDPRRLARIYTRNPARTPDFRRRHSGMVIDGAWDRVTEPLERSWKIAACLRRFRDGASWRETGVYEKMGDMIARRGQFDSCRSMDDVEARYAGIDRLFDAIRRDGFRDDTRQVLGTPRLSEGVFVHIGSDGAPIFGAIGNHRVAIARALGLSRIPAQLGVVHPKALQTGALLPFRTADS
jgi:hypothetical protein